MSANHAQRADGAVTIVSLIDEMDQDLKNLFDQAKEAQEDNPEMQDVFDKSAKVTELDDETKNVFDRATERPKAVDIFATETKKKVSARDVFSGPESLFDVIEELHPSASTRAKQVAAEAGSQAKKFLTPANIIIIANVAALLLVFGWIVYKQQTTPPPSTAEEALALVRAFHEQTRIEPEALDISDSTANALEQAKSWRLGLRLFHAHKYNQAYYVFSELREQFNTGLASDEYMRDFLNLNMALALDKTTDVENVSRLFDVALKSKAPAVRALANYYLTFISMEKGQYLNARTCAYRTLALLESLEGNLGPGVEEDCYFIICEAMTRYVIQINNEENILPGPLWANTLEPAPLPEMDQSDLTAFLQTGVYEINQGAISPLIDMNSHLNIGSRWRVISFDIPLEEVLTRLCTEIKHNLVWPENQPGIMQRPATVLMPGTSEMRAAEVTAGSAYLIARFGHDSIEIYNPENYEDITYHKNLMTAEAISAWRKFLLRYRGDHRAPNAHYCLGRLLEYSDQLPEALSEYRLIVNQYPTNILSANGLLNASIIKTNMKDYNGAARDLQELLIQYPDSRLVDQASLYLADATMNAELYDKAIKMYHKVFNIDLNPEAQRQASYGLGYCYYQAGQWQNASDWLVKAIKLISNPADYRLKKSYYLLGKANIELGNYEDASLALKNSIDTSAPRSEYIETILELADAEQKQQHFVTALKILQSIPTINLSQEYAAKILIKKAQVMQEMDLVDPAITMLRRKIEFIADSRIRAEIGSELALCYIRKGDYSHAHRELIDAIPDLPAGDYAQKMRLAFALVCYEMKQYKNAIQVAKRLELESQDAQLRKEAGQIRGKSWQQLNEPEKAALAFAGMFADETTTNQNRQ